MEGHVDYSHVLPVRVKRKAQVIRYTFWKIASLMLYLPLKRWCREVRNTHCRQLFIGEAAPKA